jgi:hypothetical protein
MLLLIRKATRRQQRQQKRQVIIVDHVLYGDAKSAIVLFLPLLVLQGKGPDGNAKWSWRQE